MSSSRSPDQKSENPPVKMDAAFIAEQRKLAVEQLNKIQKKLVNKKSPLPDLKSDEPSAKSFEEIYIQLNRPMNQVREYLRRSKAWKIAEEGGWVSSYHAIDVGSAQGEINYLKEVLSEQADKIKNDFLAQAQWWLSELIKKIDEFNQPSDPAAQLKNLFVKNYLIISRMREILSLLPHKGLGNKAKEAMGLKALSDSAKLLQEYERQLSNLLDKAGLKPPEMTPPLFEDAMKTGSVEAPELLKYIADNTAALQIASHWNRASVVDLSLKLHPADKLIDSLGYHYQRMSSMPNIDKELNHLQKEFENYEQSFVDAASNDHLDVVNVFFQNISVKFRYNNFLELYENHLNKVLKAAAKNGHVRIINRLLEIKSINFDLKSAYIAAAANGKVAATAVLSAPQIINKSDFLLIAAKYGVVSEVERLMREPGVDLNQALVVAAKNNRSAVLNKLLENPGLDINDAFNQASEDCFYLLAALPGIRSNRDMLERLAINGQWAMVDRLLDLPGNGFRVFESSQSERQRSLNIPADTTSVLILAIRSAPIHIVKKILSRTDAAYLEANIVINKPINTHRPRYGEYSAVTSNAFEEANADNRKEVYDFLALRRNELKNNPAPKVNDKKAIQPLKPPEISYSEQIKRVNAGEAPRHFLCPISGGVFEDPITPACGRTFDRQSLASLFAHKGNPDELKWTGLTIKRSELTLLRSQFVIDAMEEFIEEKRAQLAEKSQRQGEVENKEGEGIRAPDPQYQEALLPADGWQPPQDIVQTEEGQVAHAMESEANSLTEEPEPGVMPEEVKQQPGQGEPEPGISSSPLPHQEAPKPDIDFVRQQRLAKLTLFDREKTASKTAESHPDNPQDKNITSGRRSRRIPGKKDSD